MRIAAVTGLRSPRGQFIYNDIQHYPNPNIIPIGLKPSDIEETYDFTTISDYEVAILNNLLVLEEENQENNNLKMWSEIQESLVHLEKTGKNYSFENVFWESQKKYPICSYLEKYL